VSRANPFLAANPFTSEAGEAGQARKLPWVLIIAGIVSVVALGILLALAIN
jgi:hypothetical protein